MAPIPENEDRRCAALLSYEILDTPVEEAFDSLTKLASQICQAPISLISLVDSYRQWFKSRVGIDAEESARNIAFCSHAILTPEPFIIPDSLEDERFAHNPFVTSDPNIRFYAGIPLINPDGYALGTLCVIDRIPRSLDQGQLEALQILGQQVVAQLELRKSLRIMSETVELQKRSENALSEALYRLNMHNIQLKEANAAAISASHLKSAFLANMSHEIRTPMNGVLGMLEILLTTDQTPIQQKHTITAMRAGEGLLVLLNDILDFSKIEAGKLTIEVAPISLLQIIQDVCALHSVKAEQNRLVLTCELPEQLTMSEFSGEVLVGDSGRIGQVLSNLLSNAIKFTNAEGRIDFKAEMLRETATHTQWRFTIKDTGIGILPEFREQIFRSFVQADSSTTRRYGGTGLGLTISRQLAELMDGKIGMESTVGVGSTFWMELPLKKKVSALRPANQMAADTDPPVAIAGQGADEVAGARILLVEDNQINQEVVKHLIQCCGIPVQALEVAENGQEALDILASSDFDLILMDVQMPVMNGLEATQKIRLNELETKRHVPIIALTAHALPEDRDRCAAAGMDDYRTKPINLKNLSKTLIKWLPTDVMEFRSAA